MTMLSVFQVLKRKLWGGHLNSKSKAKSRLHFVLVQDRTGLTGDDMAAFKRELIRVIDRYFVIDKQGFDVSYQRENGSTTLLINSPVVVRRQETPDGNVGAKPHRRSKNRRKGKMRAAVNPGSEPGPGSAGPAPEPKVANK